MERFLVAFMAVTLLVSGAEHSRADYVSDDRFNDFGTGSAPFFHRPGVAMQLFGNLLLADTLHHRIQAFTITRLGRLPSGDQRLFELGGTAAASFRYALSSDSLDVRPPRFESDAAFLVDSGCLCIGSSYSSGLFGGELALAKEIFVADTFLQRSEMLSGDDPFLAAFSGFGIGAALSQPPRIAIDLSGSRSVIELLLDHKLLSGLSLLGIVALGILAFALRQRRVVPRRGLRGPRGTTVYRSSTPTNPRGTIR